MSKRISLISVVCLLGLVVSGFAQDAGGFVIVLKNGSSIKGRTLSRDEASGSLKLTMTESSSGSPKSYAVIAMDDAEAIRTSTTDTDSIVIRLLGGSELRCKEFGLNGDTVSVKLGTASRVDVRWAEIESISFR